MLRRQIAEPCLFPKISTADRLPCVTRGVMRETASGPQAIDVPATDPAERDDGRGSNVMKFGIRYCNTGPYVDPARAVELVQAAEAAGFESAWTVEHTVIPRGYQSAYPYAADGRLPGGEGDFMLPDPQIWMAHVAARTSRIRLATGILILPQHNPVICAKQVATLDYMSGGRILLGIGVGWLREEFDALGVPFAERGARTEEYMHALRALWSMDVPSYE